MSSSLLILNHGDFFSPDSEDQARERSVCREQRNQKGEQDLPEPVADDFSLILAICNCPCAHLSSHSMLLPLSPFPSAEMKRTLDFCLTSRMARARPLTCPFILSVGGAVIDSQGCQLLRVSDNRRHGFWPDLIS